MFITVLTAIPITLYIITMNGSLIAGKLIYAIIFNGKLNLLYKKRIIVYHVSSERWYLFIYILTSER